MDKQTSKKTSQLIQIQKIEIMETITTELTENKAFKKANLKAKKLRELYSHLRKYTIVMSIFFLINLISSPGEWWVLYPLIGWGFCLTIHAIDAFGPFTDLNDEWEGRKTRELVEKYNDR